MCKRGDIYYVDFGNQKNSHIQQGLRPAIVVSNNKANDHSHLVTVLPLTKQVQKKKHLPTHVYLPKKVFKGLKWSSLVLAEQVLTVDKFQLKNKVMTIREEAWLMRIDKALKMQVGL